MPQSDAVADSSFVYSLFNRATDEHEDVMRASTQIRGDLLIPRVTLTEVAFLFHRIGGVPATANF